MWDLPGFGVEPVSPALADGFFTTEPTKVCLLCRLVSCGFQALIAPWHVESSQMRDRAHVLRIGRWIPIHCTTKEVWGWQICEELKGGFPKLLSWVCVWGIPSLRRVVRKAAHNYTEIHLHSRVCDPMDCSMPGFPVRHQLPELAQTHVHWVDDAIQPSYPLSPPFPPTFNLSQHQGLF